MWTPVRNRAPKALVEASADREPVLDGVRGVAIILVLVHHLVVFSGIDGSSRLDRWLHELAGASWLGVDLFFVLSGFLITGTLYDAKGSPLFFRSFYGRRVLRIFPLYFGFLLLAVLVFPPWLPPDSAQNLLDGQLWYWTYLSNIHVARDGWQDPLHLGHFWSLAVEEQFYLLWPLVVWGLDRKWLMRVTAACFLTALGLRIVMPFGMDETAVYVLLPTRMDTLAAGAFLALLVRGELGSGVLGRWPSLVFATCALLLTVQFTCASVFGYHTRLERTVGYTLIACACAALIALALIAPPVARLRRAFSGRTLGFFGKYSYGLYVVHVPILLFMRDFGLQADCLPRLGSSTLPGVLAFAAVATTLSIACALASYHLWEARFLRLKKYLPYRDAPSRETAGQRLAAA